MNLRKKDCKIAIIGTGNAGIISAIMVIYTYRLLNLDEPKLTMFHDSKVPTELTGQGTTLNISHAIEKIVCDEDLNNPAGITPKVGFYYRGWGKKNEKIFYKLGENSMAYHFDPPKLRQAFLDKDLVDVIEKHVTPEDIKDDFDLIIDCRGKSVNNWDEYYDMPSPTNYCLLGRTRDGRPPEVWTEHIATPDGWTFKIPLEDGYSYGYLFNDKITSPEIAEKNFDEMFGMKTLHKVPFKGYLSKNYYDQKNKTLLNGNRLFFFEPLESNATPMYGIAVNEFINSVIRHGEKGALYAKKKYQILIQETYQWVMWHYMYGSKYDSEFWKYAQDQSKNYKYSKHFTYLINYVRKTCNWEKFVDQYEFPDRIISEFDYTDYATWYFNNV